MSQCRKSTCDWGSILKSSFTSFRHDWSIQIIVNSLDFFQHYILDVTALGEHKSYGLETSGIPEGIPSLVEYLAVYCSAAVSSTLTVFPYIFCNFSFIFIHHVCFITCIKSMIFREGIGLFENGNSILPFLCSAAHLFMQVYTIGGFRY